MFQKKTWMNLLKIIKQKNNMKKKIIITAVILGLWTGIIGWFFSNYRIRSPFEKIVITPVSETQTDTIKNKHKASVPEVFAEDRLPDTIEDKIKATFPKEPELMLAVAKGESGLRNEASSWCCHGIMQIHESVHKDKIPTSHNETKEGRIAWLRNPDNNLEIAKILYNKGAGKHHWAAYTDGSYLKFL